jgi:hypothetical protein
VIVHHGSRVETRPAWFGEVVWDGDFADAGFDETDVVFGSGGRVRDGRVDFVGPATMTDRLQSLRVDGDVWVSNSLVCLLAACEAAVDPAYGDYLSNFGSITRGIGRHEAHLETTAGKVQLTHHRNLRWDGRALREVRKPAPERDFPSFEAYRGFLAERLGRLAANLEDPARTRPFRMLGTLSSGYDSPAVAALAREAGLEEAITFRTVRLGKEDSGEEIGAELSLEVEPYSYTAWREDPYGEVPFLAGSATAGEIYLRAAQGRLEGRVLLTGDFGDSVWSRRDDDPDGVLATTDPAGLSLTEYRLWAGFIHAPIPYVGARQSADLLEIANAPEMETWQIGGYYDRPIPRRIVEEAGVPREAFGTEKAYGAVSYANPEVFWSLPAVEDFTSWLQERRGKWLRRGKLPPAWISAAARPVQALARRLHRFWRTSVESRAGKPAFVGKLRYLGTREYLFKFMFPWALERAKARYRAGTDVLSAGADASREASEAGAEPGGGAAGARVPAKGGGSGERPPAEARRGTPR